MHFAYQFNEKKKQPRQAVIWSRKADNNIFRGRIERP